MRCHRSPFQVSRSGAYQAARSADVESGSCALGGDVAAPGFEAGVETGLANIAVAVVIELYPDEIHGLHCVKWNGCVRADALGRSGDVVLLGGVGIHGGTE